MKSPSAAFVVAVMVAAASVARSDRGYVDGMLIVEFKPECAPTASEVSLAEPSPRLGRQDVDEVLARHGCSRIGKFLSTFDQATTSAGRLLERTFIVYFSGGADPALVCAELSAIPCVRSARPNRRLRKIYCGTKQFIPSELPTQNQWNLHDAANDDADIDAPEAWAIERGDPEVVIGIIDSGTMIDASAGITEEYRLHDDLTFFFNQCEDISQTNSAGYSDLNDTDDDYCEDGDDVLEDENLQKDNVIGHTFRSKPSQLTNPDLVKFWNAMPHDWRYDHPTWLWDDHGTRVASVAASIAGNGYIAGVANQCKIYVLRDGEPDTDMVQETNAIIMAAVFSDVINMSWSFEEDPGDEAFTAAIDYAAEEQDCVLVSIAGNNTDGIYEVGYPGRYAGVLAVGNIDANHDLYDSASGPGVGDVSLVAPVGSGIPAAAYELESTPFPYAFSENVQNFSGTSAAAPQVAGVAALIRSRFPGLDQAAVRARILHASEWYWGDETEDTVMYGAGKLNAYRALTEWGHITTNTTWSMADTRDGKYYVSGDLTIAPGATLTINDGVEVQIAPDNEASGADASRVEIVVKGTLKVLGTSGDPVVFESFTDSDPMESDWVGIKFEPGSKGILQHVSIQNATQDVVVTRPSVAVATWDEKKTLYLDSDLEITADMTVATDEDLYILGTSDVIVTAGGGVDLTVDGSLILKGVGEKRPEFRSSSGAARSWGVLSLSSASGGHTIHNAIIRDAQLALRTYVPVTIDSCLIRGAVDGVQSYANVVVRNTTMHDFTGNAIVWLAGNLDLRNLDVYNAGYGLHQSTATSTGTLTCRKAKFHDIDYRGIDVPSLSSGVTIKETTVRDATDGIFLGYQTSATVDSCEIRSNDIGILMLLSSGTSIKHCDVDSNATSGVFLASYTHTTMELDTIAHSPVGVYSYASNPSIQSSRLLTNTVGLKCESSADPLVRTTRIQWGTTGVLALDGSAPDLGVAAGDTCGAGAQEGLNSIQNNSSYDVSNLDPNETVYAQCDWWGGTPSGSKFYGNVVYTPYKSNDPNPAGEVIEPDPEDLPSPRVPETFALHAARPNPFNPMTTIGYDVPAPGDRVEMTIYDVSGRRIKVLVSGRRGPGAHSATWDGRGEGGAPVASGVYFVRMTAGAFTQTRKVVLLK